MTLPPVVAPSAQGGRPDETVVDGTVADDTIAESSAGNDIVVGVEPSGISVRVQRGETLMAAVARHGYCWPTVCHGQALCTACHVVLTEGPEAFAPPEPRERAGLQLFAGRSFYEGKVVRLACQAQPIADTVVTKRGVKPEGMAR